MSSPLNCETHCQSCIMKDCNASVDGCQFVTCPNACGFSMHQCKVTDHVEELCDGTLVRCINRELGCTNQMERRHLRDHLLNCPASVVYCSVQCCLPKGHPKPPDIKYGQPVQTRSISPFVPPISPAPPLPDFCRTEVTSAIVDQAKTCSPCSTESDHPDEFVQQPLTGLLGENKKQNPCARLVPRTQFDVHYRLHSEFLSPLNENIELRCPLYQLGCQFVTTRMFPYNERCQILYNPRLNRFAVRYVEPLPCLSSFPPNKSDGDSHPSTEDPVSPGLGTLPTEIINYLGTFLDDVSLLCLSEVSHRFLTIVGPLIRQRMIVTPQWQRVVYPTGLNPSSWKIKRFVWSLPDRTEEIDQWRWASAGAEMAAHLKACVYNDIVVQDRPFSLTDGTRG